MRETTSVVSEIGRQISSVDEGSTVIAAAMEEQSATILEIARHVSETAKAAAYVSDSVAVVLSEAARTGEGARSLRATVSDVDASISKLHTTIVSAVRSATAEVGHRSDSRNDVAAAGDQIRRQQRAAV